MADNIEEQQIENPANTQSENLSEKATTIQDTATIPQNLEIENMEVHKHPHHILHKKKWGEYLLEFIMLFLAVFLGFLAENWRERLVENKKETEYMHALTNDLKSDTTLINKVKQFNKKISEADSMILILLNKPTKDSQTLNKLYRLIPQSQYFDPNTNDSKTFDQLKSSGDYRLIRSEQVRNNIQKYYQHISATKIYTEEIQNNLQITYNLSFKIFDLYNFDENKNKSTPLITNEAAILKEFSNHIYLLQTNYKKYDKYFLEKIKKQATSLIILLNKEYP